MIGNLWLLGNCRMSRWCEVTLNETSAWSPAQISMHTTNSRSLEAAGKVSDLTPGRHSTWPGTNELFSPRAKGCDELRQRAALFPLVFI